MSVAKVHSYNSMKPEEKVLMRDAHDSLGCIRRQEVPFSRQGESPLQWMQLLQALDHQQGSSKVSNGSGSNYAGDPQYGSSPYLLKVNGMKESVHPFKINGVSAKTTSEQMQTIKLPEAVFAFAPTAANSNGEAEKYLPGWPLLSPPKIQLQKCDKCSREFFSPINYRRHMRVHRKSLNIEKDSSKNREFLRTFWGKLPVDEAMEVVSFKDFVVEGVTGLSIINSLASLIFRPLLSLVPQLYWKAGAFLLDIVQGKPSAFPISSQYLFSILDDASEKTFLCCGTALSLQKFVFDGEIGKIGLDMKNVVACTCFLLEQKLVKAWLADKDAEALRCQKLLVEEEEAAQRRQADLLEKRRLKKLRQREQKAKELSQVSKTDANSEPLCAEEKQLLSSPPESDTSSIEVSPTEDNLLVEVNDVPNHVIESGTWLDSEAEIAHKSDDCAIMETSVTRRTVENPLFQLAQVTEAKPSSVVKHGSFRGQKNMPLVNCKKIWTPKAKPADAEGIFNTDRVHTEAQGHTDLSSKSEVLIGSITVIIDGDNHHKLEVIPSRQEGSEMLTKPDAVVNRSSTKLWRPVSRHEIRDSSRAAGNDKSKRGGEGCVGENPNANNISSGALSEKKPNYCLRGVRCARHSEPRPFSVGIAEAFLSQRWNEALASEHVMLVLPETDASDGLDTDEDGVHLVQASNSSKKPAFLCAENRSDEAGFHRQRSTETKLPNIRTNESSLCLEVRSQTET